jgi:hypothetical protein
MEVWVMVKWIVILLVILAAVYFFGYPEYVKHQQTLKADSGDVTCQGCMSPEEEARFEKENAGETADGNSEHKLTSARIAAEQAAAGTSQSGTLAPAPGSSVAAPGTRYSTMVAPGDPSGAYLTAPGNVPVVVPTTPQPGAMPAGLPARDSESPKAPNGLRFAGSGSYQWYRQGNITWRVDTTTGRSCIIYATLEEWRKQIVMSHGCGRTA